MALTAELEDLIKELETVDPAAAKEQRALLEKFPTLQKTTQEQRLRQSDYSKKMAEVKTKLDESENIRTWYYGDKSKPDDPGAKLLHERMMAERDKAIADANTLKAEQDKKVKEAVAAATAAAGGNPNDQVTADKITEAVLAKIGDGASATKISEVVGAEVKKFGEQSRKEFFEKTFPSAQKWSAEYTNAQLLYFKETNDVLDNEKFAKFMTDNKIESPAKALEEFMKPERETKRIEKLAEERVTKILQERSQEGVPGASGPPTPPGPMQIRLAKRDPNDALFSGKGDLGDNSAASAAAAELNAEGKK